jgi:hypothetical protein
MNSNQIVLIALTAVALVALWLLYEYKVNGVNHLEGFIYKTAYGEYEISQHEASPGRVVDPGSNIAENESIPLTPKLKLQLKGDTIDKQKKREKNLKLVRNLLGEKDVIKRARRVTYAGVVPQPPINLFGGRYRSTVGRDVDAVANALPFNKLPAYVPPALDSSFEGMKYLKSIPETSVFNSRQQTIIR